jgi:hypothetical protein
LTILGEKKLRNKKGEQIHNLHLGPSEFEHPEAFYLDRSSKHVLSVQNNPKCESVHRNKAQISVSTTALVVNIYTKLYREILTCSEARLKSSHALL